MFHHDTVKKLRRSNNAHKRRHFPQISRPGTKINFRFRRFILRQNFKLLTVQRRYFLCGSICSLVWCQFLNCFNFCVSLGLGSWVATFWKRAAHSVNRMFSLSCLFVALVVSNFGFDGRTLVLIVSTPGHCLPFTF